MQQLAKFFRKVCLIPMILIMMIGASQTTSAAEEGTMMSNAVNIVFGREYTKTWTTQKDHLNHYCKIVVPKRGIITIKATKPYDSEGEYGRIYFTLYTEDSTPIWGSTGYKTKDNASDSYNFSIGLNTGTYYLTMKPGFNVISGVISTNYSISMAENQRCEVEPNGSIAESTIMDLGATYTGFYGTDGSNYDEHDYWRFSLQAGKTYKLACGNYSAFLDTSAILQAFTPDGTSISLYKMSNVVDENGMNYILYTAKSGGFHSFHVYNYNQQPFEYTLRVVEQEKKDPNISVASTSITKYESDSNFNLNATALVDLKYSSSNNTVARVISDGTVYIYKAGTTDITISSKETDIYKAGSVTVKLTVYPKTVETNWGTGWERTPSSNDLLSQPTTPSSNDLLSQPTEMEHITIPVTPASVKAKAKKNKVTVSWKKIKKTKKAKALLAQIRSIELQYSSDPSFPASISVRIPLGKKKTKFVLKGLQKRTAYYVRVRYTDGAGGYSNWSRVKRVVAK